MYVVGTEKSEPGPLISFGMPKTPGNVAKQLESCNFVSC